MRVHYMFGLDLTCRQCCIIVAVFFLSKNRSGLVFYLACFRLFCLVCMFSEASLSNKSQPENIVSIHGINGQLRAVTIQRREEMFARLW